ncbi:MAG: Smr/MutS family protein, partial [Brevundimonas sp.]|nr:Smr/MutS family protein [Brevundimonas sp.]
MTRKSDRAGSDRPAEDGDRLWQRVASTVTPLAPRRMPVSPPTAVQTAPTNRPRPASGQAQTPVPSPMPRPQSAPSDLDPRRHRRVSREREPIEARLDLHGHGRFQAEDVLTGFLLRAHQRGLRVVLVITGHGRRAGG